MPASNSYRCLEERLIANSIVSATSSYNGEPCWEWIGRRDNTRAQAYGRINVHCKTRNKTVRKKAHRVSYETFIGPIPDGMELDHLCRNGACIHPNHLEPVTGAENIYRRDVA